MDQPQRVCQRVFDKCASAAVCPTTRPISHISVDFNVPMDGQSAWEGFAHDRSQKTKNGRKADSVDFRNDQERKSRTPRGLWPHFRPSSMLLKTVRSHSARFFPILSDQDCQTFDEQLQVPRPSFWQATWVAPTARKSKSTL